MCSNHVSNTGIQGLSVPSAVHTDEFLCFSGAREASVLFLPWKSQGRGGTPAYVSPEVAAVSSSLLQKFSSSEPAPVTYRETRTVWSLPMRFLVFLWPLLVPYPVQIVLNLINTAVAGWSSLGIGANARCTLSISNSSSVLIPSPSLRIFLTHTSNTSPSIQPASHCFFCYDFLGLVYNPTQAPSSSPFAPPVSPVYRSPCSLIQ